MSEFPVFVFCEWNDSLIPPTHSVSLQGANFLPSWFEEWNEVYKTQRQEALPGCTTRGIDFSKFFEFVVSPFCLRIATNAQFYQLIHRDLK